MKQVRGRWVDYHLLWDGDNPKTMIYRTDDDVARLEFLRRKQQPGADWARDWSKVPFWTDKDFGIRIDKNDAFQAGRVSLMEDDELVALSIQMEETALHGTVDTDRHYWDGVQVKACH